MKHKEKKEFANKYFIIEVRIDTIVPHFHSTWFEGLQQMWESVITFII